VSAYRRVGAAGGERVATRVVGRVALPRDRRGTSREPIGVSARPENVSAYRRIGVAGGERVVTRVGNDGQKHPTGQRV
jgi:hypothetical protein